MQGERIVQSAIFIILFMSEEPPTDPISTLLEKPYEARSAGEHRTIAHILSSTLPHCSAEKARRLSFFLQELPSEYETLPSGMLLLRGDSEEFQMIERYHPDAASLLAKASLRLRLSESALLKSELMAWSIEEEVRILQGSEYFAQVPRRRLYAVIQQAEAVVLPYGERLVQGEGHSKWDVFFVRRGEFCYESKEAEARVEVFSFREGHLFSHAPFSPFLPASDDQHEDLAASEFVTPTPFTIRCKSSKGVLYRFTREFFASHLLRYCESTVSANAERVEGLLRERIERVASARRPVGKLLTQRVSRSLSLQLLALRDGKASSCRKDSCPIEPPRVQDITEKDHDYRTLKASQPPRNRLYSPSELAALSFNPEGNESDLLLWKKSKCLRLRELCHARPAAPKAEIMMAFMRSSVQFEKTRRRPSLL